MNFEGARKYLACSNCSSCPGSAGLLKKEAKMADKRRHTNHHWECFLVKERKCPTESDVLSDIRNLGYHMIALVTLYTSQSVGPISLFCGYQSAYAAVAHLSTGKELPQGSNVSLMASH
jgi:predicted metal-binding protein